MIVLRLILRQDKFRRSVFYALGNLKVFYSYAFNVLDGRLRRKLKQSI